MDYAPAPVTDAEMALITQRRRLVKEATTADWPILYKDGTHDDAPALQAICNGEGAYDLSSCTFVYGSEELPYVLHGRYWLASPVHVFDMPHVVVGEVIASPLGSPGGWFIFDGDAGVGEAAAPEQTNAAANVVPVEIDDAEDILRAACGYVPILFANLGMTRAEQRDERALSGDDGPALLALLRQEPATWRNGSAVELWRDGRLNLNYLHLNIYSSVKEIREPLWRLEKEGLLDRCGTDFFTPAGSPSVYHARRLPEWRHVMQGLRHGGREWNRYRARLTGSPIHPAAV